MMVKIIMNNSHSYLTESDINTFFTEMIKEKEFVLIRNLMEFTNGKWDKLNVAVVISKNNISSIEEVIE